MGLALEISHRVDAVNQRLNRKYSRAKEKIKQQAQNSQNVFDQLDSPIKKLQEAKEENDIRFLAIEEKLKKYKKKLTKNQEQNKELNNSLNNIEENLKNFEYKQNEINNKQSLIQKDFENTQKQQTIDISNIKINFEDLKSKFKDDKICRDSLFENMSKTINDFKESQQKINGLFLIYKINKLKFIQNKVYILNQQSNYILSNINQR